MRVKVDVKECTTAGAVILLLCVARLQVQRVKSVISFVKEELVFQENTGGGTLGVTDGVRGCTSIGAGDLTPSHL